ASSVDVTVNSNPNANAGADVTILSGESTLLTGSGGLSYIWNPPGDLSCTACSSPTATPSITTNYYLTVSDANGCTAVDSVLITLDFQTQDFFVPNAFSPNGDNHNDFFEIEGTGLNDFYVRVFNRWGELIFDSEDQSISWDGTQNGKALNTAVFAYSLTYTDSFGVNQVVSGNVTLIK
ncbi:MAG: gliding motility-associated C-terminal domain-containing protein, partial [Crocinitomicaceae bacterium]|nr:gliding motility-associated C-terminal domain-containing protein [Crocinitomicaceae bacterium]